MSKLRIFFAVIILAAVTFTGFAQVDRDELENLPPVVFINYVGPHAKVDTKEQIIDLGVVLGKNIAEKEKGIASTLASLSAEQKKTYSYKFEAGGQNRYYVIHCVSGADGNKLDADIFCLGVDAGVDHVRNLRWIIQGYLQHAYDYSEQDAAVLAEFITIYNAVYRGNWDFFTEKYKTQVISNLDKDKAGLSIRYDEWPGRTMMLIPLGQGGLSTIDTTEITDQRVIEELRREDDQGVQQRQDMVDLVERQADEADRRAQRQREDVRREERQIAEERRQVEEERVQIERERRQIIDDRDAGRITEEEAVQQEEDLDRREREAQVREDIAEKRDRELDEQRQEAQRTEEYAEQKYEEAQRQREEIARDQQAAIVQETVGGVFGVTLERTDPTLIGRIVTINPANGAEIRRSPLDTVHVRTVTFIGGRLIAIAGENIGNRAVRLVEINQTNLEMAKQGDDDIKTGSLLWVNGTDLYAITTDLRTGQCFLGRFDTNLVMQAKSAVRINSQASVTIQQGRLLTQRENGSPLLLNPVDLTEIKN